jgi:anti-sigma-K factor RskA
MNGHPQHEEDFDLYALGVLEGEERKALEAHIAGCAACEAKLAEARGRVSLLALAAKPLAPPASVKNRLMEQVRAESSQARSPVAAQREQRSGGLFGRWTLALAAAAVLLAVATGWLWHQKGVLDGEIQKALQESKDAQAKIQKAQNVIEVLQAPDSTMITLASLDLPQASGKVCYNARLGKLACATHLSAPSPGKEYQLWLVPIVGNPMSASVFGANMSWTDDMWIADVKAGTAAKAFAVTLEPAGGMPQPTGPKVLVGAMPQTLSFLNPNGAVQAYYKRVAARRAADGSFREQSPDWSVQTGDTLIKLR